MKKVFGSNFFERRSIKALPLVVSFLLPLIYSQLAISASDNNKVNIKCYVSLVNGNEIISFWSVSQNKMQKLKDNIIGKKVQPVNSKKKVKIYKAYECVLEDNTFESSKARLLDNKTPR